MPVSNLLLCLLVVTLLLNQMPPVEEPPLPDFKKHVDYVQWFKQQQRFADTDNAWQDYRQFMEEGHLPQLPPKAQQQMEALLDAPRPWDDEFPALTSWLQSTEQQFKAYRTGARHKFFAAPVGDDARLMIDIQAPELAPSRLLTKAAVARAWQADGLFSADHFIEHLRLVTRHANHVDQGMMVLHQLVGLVTRGLVYQSALGALHDNLLMQADLQQLEDLLEQEDAQDRMTLLARGLNAELASMYDTLQAWCTQSGVLGTQFSRAAALESKRWMEQNGMQFLSESELNQVLQQSPSALATQAQGYFRTLRERAAGKEGGRDSDTFAQDAYAKLVESSVLFKLYVADLHKVFAQAIRTETLRRGVRVMLAVTRYKMEKGNWPAKLDDPALKLPPALRKDPRSGGDLVYKVTGDKVLLYSVGKDGKDDGGTQLGAKYEEKPGEDLVIWPLKR